VINALVFGEGKLGLSVDPGGNTGWLLFKPVLDEEQPTGRGIEPVDWGEDRNQIDFLNKVWTWLTRKHPLSGRGLDFVVVEGWWPRPGLTSTWEPEAVEIIGTLRWMLADDQTRFFVQKVSDAESFGTPAKINHYRRNRAAPFNVGKGGEGHAVMALKHAVLWTNTRWAPEPQS
jgi:hypothetical protein